MLGPADDRRWFEEATVAALPELLGLAWDIKVAKIRELPKEEAA